MEQAHPAFVYGSRGLAERLKTTSNELRALCVNSNLQAIPGDYSGPPCLESYFIALRKVGKKDGEILTVNWQDFQLYATRSFWRAALAFGAGDFDPG